MLLSFEETQKLFKKYRLPLIETAIIETAQDGIEFAERFGWPVVLKVEFEEIYHRTELGLVKIGIRSTEELNQAFNELKMDFSKGRILAQRTGQGIEVICGLKRDPVFGPFLIFGLGGIFVEVLKDITFAIAPITKKEAYEMIARIKGHTLFKGFRGRDPLYTEKVIDVLLNLSKIALAEPSIQEINLNPIFVSETQVAIADAKVII